MTRKQCTTLHHPKSHPDTKFGKIPILNNTNAPDMNILKTRSEVKVKVTVTRKWYATLFHSKMHTPNFGFLSQIIREVCSGHNYSKNKIRGQGHSYQKMVCDTLPSHDAFAYQILNFYLKEYRRYAQHSGPIRGQDHNDPRIVRDNSSSQDACTQ